MEKHVILHCDANNFSEEENRKTWKLFLQSAAKLAGKGVKVFSYAFKVFKTVQGVSLPPFSPIKQILTQRQ